MTDGLKRHTHEDRDRIVASLVPLIERHWGGDLVALAVTGSFARNADASYSDIEFLAFTKHIPTQDRVTAAFIYDGMLIDIWSLTEDQYLKHHKTVINREWPYRVANHMQPIINEAHINRLEGRSYRPKKHEIDRNLRKIWHDSQESTGKLLNAIEQNNTEIVPLLYWSVVEHLCVALAFINEAPFTTKASLLSDTRAFSHLPSSFDQLVVAPDQALEPAEYGRRVMAVFDEIEQMLQARGLDLYTSDLGAFVSPESNWVKLRRDLGFDWFTQKLQAVARRLAKAVS